MKILAVGAALGCRALCVLLLLFFRPAWGAEEAVLFDGGLRLLVPPGYTRLSQAEIRNRLGLSGTPPLAAFGDAGRDATIAITLAPWAYRVGELNIAAVKAELEKMLPRAMPALRWHERRLVEMGDRLWIYFEITTRSKKADMHNALYFTAYQGQLLGVNAVAPVADWPAVAPALKQLAESVQVGVPGWSGYAQPTR